MLDELRNHRNKIANIRTKLVALQKASSTVPLNLSSTLQSLNAAECHLNEVIKELSRKEDNASQENTR